MIGTHQRRWWAVGVAAAIAASTYRAGVGGDLINTSGWSSFAEFWAGIFDLRLDAEFLALVWSASLTTLSFAVLGTILSVAIGMVFAPILSERVWASEVPLRGAPRFFRRAVRQLVTLGGVAPRALHEVIWALLLAQVYGTAPIVAVLAIGIPFGATTAAVFADTFDEADGRSFSRLRADGAGRIRALAYGLLPDVSGDMISYSFYRFECSVRSAAILGLIGAGGLGYEIDLSFQTLKYGEMWTMIGALVILSAGADAVSSRVRRRGGSDVRRCGDIRAPSVTITSPDHVEARNESHGTSHASSRKEARTNSVPMGVMAVGLAAACWWYVEMDLSILWEDRRRELLGRLLRDMLPPRLPPGGWSELLGASIDTVAMAVLAIAISSIAGFAVAMISMRRTDSHIQRGVAGAINRVGRTARSFVMRLVMLVFRAVPPPVWAFVAVLVLYPGMWPGVVALAVYNTGVLSRLFGESLEEMDPEPMESLAAIGVRRTVQLWYAAVPLVARRFIALAAYRWEVLTRETVIVGVVGAAGMGRLIQDEFVARDFAGVTSSLIALTLLILGAGMLTRRLRAALG